jgi:hypothetical protein
LDEFGIALRRVMEKHLIGFRKNRREAVFLFARKKCPCGAQRAFALQMSAFAQRGHWA